MKPLGKRRNGTCRQARTDKLCQIVRILDGLAQYLSPAQNLGNRLCFHAGPLATHDTPFGRTWQSGSPVGLLGLPNLRRRTVPVLYRCGYFVSFWTLSAFLESVSYTFHEAYENHGSNPCRGTILYFQLLTGFLELFLYRCCTSHQFR